MSAARISTSYKWATRISFLAAALSVFVGVLFLAGRALDVDSLQILAPDGFSMKANAAACFVMLGLALWSRTITIQTIRLKFAAHLALWLVTLTGLLTFIEYLSGLDFGVDQLLFFESADVDGAYYFGRMNPSSALSFVMLGLALLMNGTKRMALAATGLSLLVASFALAALLSYLTPSLGSQGWFGYEVIDAPATPLFLLLGVSISWLIWQKNSLRWSLSKWAALAILCGLVWLATVGLNVSRSQFEREAASQKMQRSEAVIGDIQQVMIATIDAQARVRGYLIAGEASLKDSFADAKTEACDRIAALHLLVKDTPLEQQQLSRIEQQVKNHLLRLQSIVDAKRLNAAERSQTILQGEKHLDELRSTLRQIETEQKQYLAKLQQEATDMAYFSNMLAYIGTLSSLLVFLIALLRLNVTETRNHRLTNLYAALSQCNQAIVRCSSADELFAQICRDVVEFGGMKMAWIGMRSDASQGLKPVAVFGEGSDYLDGDMASTDEFDPEGRGPAGMAIRNNQPYWCQDFLHDRVTATWHERGALFGWGSLAALPLQCKGEVVGAFMLYTYETDAFDEDARNLLLEMAMDISYALDSFANEAERKQVDSALRESEERYSKAFMVIPPEISCD